MGDQNCQEPANHELDSQWKETRKKIMRRQDKHFLSLRKQVELISEFDKNQNAEHISEKTDTWNNEMQIMIQVCLLMTSQLSSSFFWSGKIHLN